MVPTKQKEKAWKTKTVLEWHTVRGRRNIDITWNDFLPYCNLLTSLFTYLNTCSQQGKWSWDDDRRTWRFDLRELFAVDRKAITQSFFQPQITISDCRADLSGRGVGRGRARPGSITRGSWAAVCGRVDPGRPHRVISGDERHSKRGRERGWQRSGIPVSVDVVRDTLGWVRHAPLNMHAETVWMKDENENRIREKKVANGHHRWTAFHRDDVS